MSDSHRTVANPIYVTETLLKKRKVNERAAAIKAQQRLEQRKLNKKQQKTQFKRADEFIKTFKANQQQGRRIGHFEKGLAKNAHKKGDGKLLFIVRIKTDTHFHYKLKLILKKYRLWKMNSGVFAICDDSTLKDLQLIEPYVTYGVPTLKTVRDLIIKRGSTLVEGERKALTDNAMIEGALGEKGIICLEDIVHEIVNMGDEFNTVNTYLAPFELNNPVKGWRQMKLKDVIKRSNSDEDEKDDINTLVSEMN
ncbi:ribosomal protein L30, ferredoxin-like fold domain-containing protein [Pilobolus umbonatus]|nr:ribosomal protein L30, ferredoxin-like fold domain-containing protein [Pilobolus umbonatus]